MDSLPTELIERIMDFCVGGTGVYVKAEYTGEWLVLTEASGGCTTLSRRASAQPPARTSWSYEPLLQVLPGYRPPLRRVLL